MSESNYMLFEEVVKLLNRSEDEIMDMVLEGKIRSTRINKEIRLNEENVRRLAAESNSANESENILALDDEAPAKQKEPIRLKSDDEPESILVLEDEPTARLTAQPPKPAKQDETLVLEEESSTRVIERNDATQVLVSDEDLLDKPGVGLSTEEIEFIDSDLDIDHGAGTQEVTRIQASETATIAMAALTELEPEAKSQRRRRRGGASSESMASRYSGKRYESAAKPGQLLTNVALIAICLMLILPTFIYVASLVGGRTTGAIRGSGDSGVFVAAPGVKLFMGMVDGLYGKSKVYTVKAPSKDPVPLRSGTSTSVDSATDNIIDETFIDNTQQEVTDNGITEEDDDNNATEDDNNADDVEEGVNNDVADDIENAVEDAAEEVGEEESQVDDEE